MAYSSLIQAKDRLKNPRSYNSSSILYASDKLFSNTTTFYINASKSVLAPAGNYVIPTQYKSYYTTLGSNGRFATAPLELLTGSFDTNFVNDGIRNGDSYVPNTGSAGPAGDIGGTQLSITTDCKLTDAFWSSRPYNNPKRWMIDCGIRSTSPITDIDLSDMKGYDLRLVTGEWNGTKFTYLKNIYAIIHLASEPNRQTIFGNKIYFFRPDYWVSDSTFDSLSYFRRMPNINPLKDRYGREKLWIDMARPMHDFMEPITHNNTTSVRMSKGVTQGEKNTWRQTSNGATQISDIIPRSKRFYFDGDLAFRDAIRRAYNVPFTDVGLGDPLWDNRICAMIQSLTVDNFTWENGTSAYAGIPFRQANPFQWTTAFFGGYPNDTGNLVQGMSSKYYEIAEGNGGHVHYDWEHLPTSLYSENLGSIVAACHASARQTVYIDNSGGQAAGAADPKYSIYGRGIYQSVLFGQEGFGWNYVGPGSNAAATGLYGEYHNYFINSSVAYTSLGNYLPFFKGAGDNFPYHFISNYCNRLDERWYFYSMMHNYDVAKKILAEVYGTNDNNARVCGYFWRYLEPLGDTSDWDFTRRYIEWNGNISSNPDNTRIENSPSTMQSIAVWAMAYCDGIFMWDFGYVGEENGAVKQLQISNNGSFDDFVVKMQLYGDTTMVGKGSQDWAYSGYLQVVQNKDIVEANTAWLVPDYKNNGTYTTGTANYPVMLYNQSIPLCRYKLSADGTEALVLIVNPHNNGYTKGTHTLRMPAKSNYEFTVDTWGNFTTVMRIKNL